MLKIDFYILQKDAPNAEWLFACKLIEKAYERGHQIYIHCASEKDAQAFDELLWEFNPLSFIPHHIQGEGPEPPPPVQIGFQPSSNFRDILINLAPDVPEFYSQFKRIFEIVPQDETQKIIKRTHYKFYQSQQYPIENHKIEH